ncbi:ATP-binding cassette domain-containing protein, partial [Nocardioides sp. J9]|uniref:ATP-binding cassette domain-containing protein n=1 Tax=Nocardioides sp. J9 TaxID=935844 RepID=UPI0021BD12DC
RATGLLDEEALRTPVDRLSEGQRRRLHLALCLAARPDVLLLDEPTNHLSIALVDELTRALETASCAVVVATHDRQLLADTANWPRLALGDRGPRTG